MSVQHGPAIAAYERRVKSLAVLIAKEITEQETRDHHILDVILTELGDEAGQMPWGQIQKIVANVIDHLAVTEAFEVSQQLDNADPADITGGVS